MTSPSTPSDPVNPSDGADPTPSGTPAVAPSEMSFLAFVRAPFLALRRRAETRRAAAELRSAAGRPAPSSARGRIAAGSDPAGQTLAGPDPAGRTQAGRTPADRSPDTHNTAGHTTAGRPNPAPAAPSGLFQPGEIEYARLRSQPPFDSDLLILTDRRLMRVRTDRSGTIAQVSQAAPWQIASARAEDFREHASVTVELHIGATMRLEETAPDEAARFVATVTEVVTRA